MYVSTEPEARPVFTEATCEAERLSAAALAARIYCEEHLGLPWEQGRPLLYDPEAARAASQVLVARHQGEVVATVWLHHPDPARAAAEGTRYGLPMERLFDLSAWRGPAPIQVSHAACRADLRGRGLSHALWSEAVQRGQQSGILITAATGLRDPARAAGLWAQLRRPGLPLEARLRCAAQGVQGAAPQTGDVPWLIRSYARFGLVAVGEPVYLPRFRMFDLPMWMPPAEA